MTPVALTLEPAPEHWPTPTANRPPRHALAHTVNENARRLGTGPWPTPHAPVIATGHQAAPWHPGILAKDLAAHALAQRHGGVALHVVVDQDDAPALTFDRPRVVGQRIVVETDRILPGTQRPGVPVGWHEPTRNDGPCVSLAEQVTVELERHRNRVIGSSTPVVFASQLLALDAGQELVAMMRRDAAGCSRAYNDAARARPESGVTLLQESAQRVELPLWSCSDSGRRRVFAAGGELVNERGQAVDAASLAPRALVLTALMRLAGCDLFIHGRGGGVYDRVTDAWFQTWLGRTPGPTVVVSADMHLRFDVPVADRAERDRAVWRSHHLPHNLDALPGESQAATRKRELLDALRQSTDRRERARHFADLHTLRHTLMQRHAEPLSHAMLRAQQAVDGVANEQAARRRDWYFALYPDEQLHELRDAIFRAIRPTVMT